MSHLPLHEQQLEFMIDLAGNRIGFLDPFFRFLHYFDSPYFFFVLIPVIWLGFSYQWGLRIFYWFTLNSLVITLVKNAICWPRPSTDLPEIGMYHPSSYGFPSGGAQTCMFLGGILIYYWRTRAAWVIGSVYILLISFSRLYLGVHYPIDVLGGWVIAAILIALFIITKDPFEKWLAKRGPKFCLVLSLAIPVVLMLLIPKRGIYYIMGSTMGVGLGTYFSLQHHLFLPRSKNLNEGVGRSIIGIATLALIVFLWPEDGSFAKSFVAGLFMSLAASPICRWFLDRKV
jgi:membrane-associated phospholipid phosphatase